MAGPCPSALSPCQAPARPLPSLGLVSHCLPVPGRSGRGPSGDSRPLLQSLSYGGGDQAGLQSGGQALPRPCHLLGQGGLLRTSPTQTLTGLPGSTRATGMQKACVLGWPLSCALVGETTGNKTEALASCSLRSPAGRREQSWRRWRGEKIRSPRGHKVMV